MACAAFVGGLRVSERLATVREKRSSLETTSTNARQLGSDAVVPSETTGTTSPQYDSEEDSG